MRRPQITHDLHVAHRQLKRDGNIDLELDSLDQLLDGHGRDESGVDSLVGILDSSLRLPDTLVLRIALPGEGSGREPDVDGRARAVVTGAGRGRRWFSRHPALTAARGCGSVKWSPLTNVRDGRRR